MKKNLATLLIVPFVLGLGCGKSKDKKTELLVDPKGETELCTYAADVGDAFSASAREAKYETGLFEKEYRRDWLDGILTTSIRETLRVPSNST